MREGQFSLGVVCCTRMHFTMLLHERLVSAALKSAMMYVDGNQCYISAHLCPIHL